MNLFASFRVVFALAVLMVGLGAKAIPLTTVDTPLGVGTGTLDPATGLTWLDLDRTRPFSYDALITAELLPGGTFAGFRFATRDEVDALVSDSGILPPLKDTAAKQGFDTLQIQIGANVVDDVDGNGCLLLVNGVAAGFRGAGFANNRFNQTGPGCQSPDDDLNSFNELKADDGLFGLLQNEVIGNHEPNIAGAWLVLAANVPAPGGMGLLLLGIAALAWQRRNYTSAVR
jgi:hypothetical protein